MSRIAPVVEWIQYLPPKEVVQVRFLPGAQYKKMALVQKAGLYYHRGMEQLPNLTNEYNPHPIFVKIDALLEEGYTGLKNMLGATLNVILRKTLDNRDPQIIREALDYMIDTAGLTAEAGAEEVKQMTSRLLKFRDAPNGEAALQ